MSSDPSAAEQEEAGDTVIDYDLEEIVQTAVDAELSQGISSQDRSVEGDIERLQHALMRLRSESNKRGSGSIPVPTGPSSQM
jgi:hypothetical protein